ncbi:hypothetical protein [Rossellomorea aquimaris]|nr:hypothetical protein [Rossellomorea aquimaris]
MAMPIQQRLAKKAENIEAIATTLSFTFYISLFLCDFSYLE